MLSEKLRTVRDIFQSLAARGLVHLTAEDATMDGRRVTIHGRTLVNFGSASYVGLETDERLKQGACDAVNRYGVQFASSRAYLSCTLYTELEELLTRIFGAHVVVAQTTSLAHFAALPCLAGKRDAVVFDQFVHASAQAVAPTLREAGATCLLLPHNNLDMLEQRIAELRDTHQRIWYVADGIYSMGGDAAPMGALREMLARHEQLHLYIDDAHGMSWTGLHGRGFALEAPQMHPRMVVVLSLAKGFSASGAAMVFPDLETAKLVRCSGSTMIFSGPLQPALLGAAIASARLHLSPDLVALQRGIRERIDLFNGMAHSAGLPLRSDASTPIRFVKIGPEEETHHVAERLLEMGYFVNCGVYPGVPKGRGGIRVSLTVHQTLDDIRGLVDGLSSLCRRAPHRSIKGTVGAR